MFICALDIRQFSLRMILTVKAPVPIFLEAQYFQFPVEPAVILNSLQTWADFYKCAPDYLLGCRQDPWPSQLKEVLQDAGYHIEWVTGEDIDRMTKIWNSLQQDGRWLRGGLMAYFCGHSSGHSSPDEVSRITVLEWMYATLRFQLMELEGELYAEGIVLCPGHMSLKCPICETGDKGINLHGDGIFI